MALAAKDDDDDDTDFLIGACMDAASAYEVAAAVVETAPGRHGPAIVDLKRAFEAEGEAALRLGLTRTRARVIEVNQRIGSGALSRP